MIAPSPAASDDATSGVDATSDPTSSLAPDDAMDELIRQEIEAAFADLATFDGSDDEAIELIRSQGKTVFSKVLARMEEEGTLLSATLSKRVENLASEQTAEMLERYEARISEVRVENERARQALREELNNLQALSDEYDELVASGPGSGFSRDGFVSGAAFLVGLSGVGAACNEGLQMLLGVGGDGATLAANAVLGLGGVGYYFQRKK